MEPSDRREDCDSAEPLEVPYYGLWTKPFRENSDPTFLWLGPQYREAFAALRAAVLQNAGLLILAGEVGTGKTMLARALADSLGAEVRAARLTYAGLQPAEFWNAVAQALDLPGVADTPSGVPAPIEAFLRGAYARREKILLVIDEAQDLAPDILDEIGQLSRTGLEAGRGKVNVINILLVGQPAIVALLGHRGPRGESLAIARLGPLPPEQVAEYIAFRLRVAGADRELFSGAAVAEIAVAAAGIPRLVSRICDYALHVASQRNEAVVSVEVVAETLSDFGLTAPGGATRPHPLGGRGVRRIAYAAALTLTVGLGALVYQGGASNIHGNQGRDDPASVSGPPGAPASVPISPGDRPEGEPSSTSTSPGDAGRAEAEVAPRPEQGRADTASVPGPPVPEARADRLEPERSPTATPAASPVKVRPRAVATSRRAERSPGTPGAASPTRQPEASGSEGSDDPAAIINWLLQGHRPGAER